MCLDLTCLTRFDASALALKLSHPNIGFLGSGIFNSFRRDLIQVILAAKLARALYLDSMLDLDTTFYYLEDQEINVSPRKTHCPPMDFLSYILVAQPTSENPFMSKPVEGLTCRQ